MIRRLFPSETKITSLTPDRNFFNYIFYDWLIKIGNNFGAFVAGNNLETNPATGIIALFKFSFSRWYEKKYIVLILFLSYFSNNINENWLLGIELIANEEVRPTLISQYCAENVLLQQRCPWPWLWNWPLGNLFQEKWSKFSTWMWCIWKTCWISKNTKNNVEINIFYPICMKKLKIIWRNLLRRFRGSKQYFWDYRVVSFQCSRQTSG